MLFWPILGHFWWPGVPIVTFSNNLRNFKSIKKSPQKIQIKFVQSKNQKNERKNTFFYQKKKRKKIKIKK